MDKLNFKTIWVHKNTYDKLNKYGSKSETYSDIVTKILDVYEKYRDVYEKENKRNAIKK